MSKVNEMDSLRGLMAGWVFLSHVCFFAGLKDGPFALIAMGGPAVTVFIILSGFAITISLLRSESSYSDYIARRFFRIYPVYLIGLAMGLATSFAYPDLLASLEWVDPTSIDRIDRRTDGEADAFWLHLVAHLTLLHGIIPDNILYGSALTFNGVLWSLSLEWQFYLVAPLLVAGLIHAPRNWGLFITIVGIIALAPLVLSKYYTQVPSFLPPVLGWFAVGILSGAFYERLKNNKEVLLTAAFLLVGVAAMSSKITVVLPICIWVACYVIARDKSLPGTRPFHHLLSNKWLIACGERSYGFYLFHMPILIVWAIALDELGLAENKYLFAALLMPSAIVCLVLAWLSYDHLEMRITKWAGKKFRRTTSAGSHMPA